MSDDPLDDPYRREREATCRRMALRRFEFVEARCLEAALFARRAEELREEQRRELEPPRRVWH